MSGREGRRGASRSDRGAFSRGKGSFGFWIDGWKGGFALSLTVYFF